MLCKLFLLLLCAVVALLFDCANSANDGHVYLWRITRPADGMAPSYLLGTMLAPWKEIYQTIPASIEDAIKQADIIMRLLVGPEDVKSTSKFEMSNLARSVIQRTHLIGPSTIPFQDRILQLLPNLGNACHNLPLCVFFICLREKLMEKFYNPEHQSLEQKIVEMGKSFVKAIDGYGSRISDFTEIEKGSEEKALSDIGRTVRLAEDRKFKDDLQKKIKWFKNGWLTATNFAKFKSAAGQTVGKDEWEEMRAYFYANDYRTANLIHSANKNLVEEIEEINKNIKKSFLLIVPIVHLIQEEQSLIKLLKDKGYTVEAWPKEGAGESAVEKSGDDPRTMQMPATQKSETAAGIRRRKTTR